MIKLQFKFNKLVTVTLNHSYFDNGKARYMSVEPTGYTSSMLNSLGLLERFSENELVILFDKEKEDLLAKKLTDLKQVEFSFLVYCNDYSLVNYTQLPLDLFEGILCLENSKSKNLHSSDYVSANEFSRIIHPGMVLSDDFKSLQVLDNHQNVILNVSSEEQPVSYMTDVRTGIYHIKKDKAAAEKIVCLNERSRKRPIGLININLDAQTCNQIIKAIEKGDDPEKLEYQINFKSRETYWKYLIISKYVKGIEESRIETNDKKIEFSKGKETQLVTGQKAIGFESSKPIAMHEFTSHQFQLVGKSAGMGNKVILKRMPAPPTDMIQPESRAADSKVYSEILIYV
ncbi:hypothetical protein [Marinigracilibium pacificum]|uniref:Uncharacterized protein n=1 Tax=Marinigracilibium pacificum TaxID=2729599 RepID=A0A848IZA6_9BACT|nr:hypothetical protein [Marinigracilibium pacificum]NMM48478.1 hypothetical protein [Marinigracilibium pacificum]